MIAALPQHMAASLWLTVARTLLDLAAPPPAFEAQPRTHLNEPERKGRAFPLCAAAKPQTIRKSYYLGLTPSDVLLVLGAAGLPNGIFSLRVAA